MSWCIIEGNIISLFCFFFCRLLFLISLHADELILISGIQQYCRFVSWGKMRTVALLREASLANKPDLLLSEKESYNVPNSAHCCVANQNTIKKWHRKLYFAKKTKKTKKTLCNYFQSTETKSWWHHWK